MSGESVPSQGSNKLVAQTMNISRDACRKPHDTAGESFPAKITRKCALLRLLQRIDTRRDGLLVGVLPIVSDRIVLFGEHQDR